MDVNQLAGYLKTNIDWRRFSTFQKKVGTQLNSEQLRFLKARAYELTLARMFSNNKLVYVAKDGCDFIIPEFDNLKLEMKYTAGAIFSPKNKMKKTCSIKLMNSHGSNTHKTLPSEYADYLLFVSDTGAVLFDKPTIEQHSVFGGDGITANIPTNLGIIVADKTVMNLGMTETVDILNKIDQIFMDVAASC
jgi:hypothetical protein